MLKYLVQIVLAMSCNAAFGAASGSVVFDPTNYSQTLITAGQSVKQVAETISGNLTRLKQLEEIYKQGKALGSGDMSAIAGLVAGGQLQYQLRDMQRLKSALYTLNGDIDDVSGRYNYTMQMAQKYGMTVQQYQDAQTRRVSRDIASAKIEQQQNKEALQRVEDSYKQVQKWQENVPETNTALYQQMNNQMALLNANNAQILAFMARASKAEFDKKIDASGVAAGLENDAQANQAEAKKINDAADQRIKSGYQTILKR